MLQNNLILKLCLIDIINIDKIIKLPSNIDLLLDSKSIESKYANIIKEKVKNRNIYFVGYGDKNDLNKLSHFTILPIDYKFYSTINKKNYISIDDYYIFNISKNIIFHSYDYVFSNKKLFEENWNKYYKKNIKTNIPWGKSIADNHIINFYKNFIKTDEKLKVLDVGCGAGKNSVFFYQKGHDITGIDISQEAIDFCKNKYPEINFLNLNIEDLKGGTYDIIIDGGCLHVNHLYNQKKIIQKYNKLINDDGILFIRYFNVGMSKKNIGPINTIDNMLIYGINKNYINTYFGIYFNILNISFEKNYGEYGCFYIVLKKRG